MQRRKVNLLEGPILKTLLILSAPLMATAFVQMTYNLVDMAWVGRLGTKEVAAIGASGVFNWIAASIAAIARVGSNVYSSQYYGAGEENKLRNNIKSGMALVVILAGLYFVFIQIMAPKLIGIYNLEADVNKLAISYLRIISLGYVVQFLNPFFSSIYNSIGDSLRPFKMNSVGLIVNLILDPLLIFGFSFIPGMGIIGAGVATVLAQVVVTILFLFDINKSKNEVYEGLKMGRIERKHLGEIFKMGFPAGIQSIFMASISLVLNKFVASYGATPLAVYTIGTNMESISWMTTEGFQGGIIAFVGQNYGAKNIPRLKEIIRKSMKVVATIGLIGTFILIFFRRDLFNIFLPGDELAAYQGAYFLLILGSSQLFMTMEIGAAGVFHGLGLTKIPSIISIVFNFIRVPLAMLLMPHLQFYGVWIAVTISSILKGVCSNYILYKKYHSLS